MLLKLAGVTFASDRDVRVKTLQPSGIVKFEAESDNEHDPNAVKVLYNYNDEYLHIGYVPKSEEAQKVALEYGTATIVDYCYWDSDLKFNNNNIGQFQSLTMEIADTEIDNGRIIGGRYLRVTQFLKYFDPYGSSEGLIKWAFNQGGTYEEYEEELNTCAENGTLMHDSIEKFFRGEEHNEDYLPQGWSNFLKKYEPEFLSGEERFYDNDLGVTGQPDFIGTIVHKGKRKKVLLDWKSSKRPSKKHEMQISVYSMNTKIDDDEVEGAMIVAFGSDNKQGFATKWLDPDQIKSYYQGCIYIKKAMECCNAIVKEYY
jgi:hypothetical protein